MSDLGRDVAKLVRLAYPTADQTTREVIGINSFLDALPGPASEIKLHVIKGRPRSLQEATAHATEVEAVMEAEGKRFQKKRGDARQEIRMVGEDEKFLMLEKRCEELEKSIRRSNPFTSKGRKDVKRPVVCFGCKEEGHFRKDCPKEKTQPKSQDQGNVSLRLDQ